MCNHTNKLSSKRITFHATLHNNNFKLWLNLQEVFESNRRDITVAMTKNYPLLLRKFMADKAKIPSLVEIIIHMNLELYSLKRQEQVGGRIFCQLKLLDAIYNLVHLEC